MTTTITVWERKKEKKKPLQASIMDWMATTVRFLDVTTATDAQVRSFHFNNNIIDRRCNPHSPLSRILSSIYLQTSKILPASPLHTTPISNLAYNLRYEHHLWCSRAKISSMERFIIESWINRGLRDDRIGAATLNTVVFPHGGWPRWLGRTNEVRFSGFCCSCRLCNSGCSEPQKTCRLVLQR